MKKQIFRITESDVRDMVMEYITQLIQENISNQHFGSIGDDNLPDFFDSSKSPKPEDYPYEEDPDAYKGEEYVDLGDGDLYR